MVAETRSCPMPPKPSSTSMAAPLWGRKKNTAQADVRRHAAPFYIYKR